MFGIQDIQIDFLTSNPWLVSLFFIFTAALSVYLYLKTNPPIKLYLKIILGALRLLAVTALFLVLFQPVISYKRVFQQSPQITVLLDESLSLSKEEDGKSRITRRDSILSSESFSQLEQRSDLSLYYFGKNISPDKNLIEKNETALGNSLLEFEANQLDQAADYLFLFSDGNSNSGRDPNQVAAELSSPIIAVDITTGSDKYDINIEHVDFNPVMFTSQPSTIKVRLGWVNALEKTVEVQLIDDRKIVSSKRLNIKQSEGLAEIDFEYTPLEPARKLLKINIPIDQNEEVATNNSQNFAVKVMKSKMKVLLAAHVLDYEVGFLKRYFDNSEKYEVELRLLGANHGNLGSAFPDRQIELNKYDLVILYDPIANQLASKTDLLESYLADKGGSLWVIMGGNYSKSPKQEKFNNLLPFYATQNKEPDYLTFNGEPSQTDLYHPSIRLGDNQNDIRSNWNSLPPFELLVKSDFINPRAEILLYADLPGKDKYPIAGFIRKGPGKVFATASLPFWSWGFTNLGFGEDNQFYGMFVGGTASWLTVADDFDPIRISSDKEVYHRHETIRFDGYAFDQGYRPIPGVTGLVKLLGIDDGGKYETDLIAVGDGQFRGEFTSVVPGKYDFEAQFKKENLLLKKIEGSLLVESFSREEYDQRANSELMKSIASLSGGRYVKYNEFDRVFDELNFELKEIEEQNEHNIWNKFWLLLLFVLALTLEWTLRKINQLL